MSTTVPSDLSSLDPLPAGALEVFACKLKPEGAAFFTADPVNRSAAFPVATILDGDGNGDQCYEIAKSQEEQLKDLSYSISNLKEVHWLSTVALAALNADEAFVIALLNSGAQLAAACVIKASYHYEFSAHEFSQGDDETFEVPYDLLAFLIKVVRDNPQYARRAQSLCHLPMLRRVLRWMLAESAQEGSAALALSTVQSLLEQDVALLEQGEDGSNPRIWRRIDPSYVAALASIYREEFPGNEAVASLCTRCDTAVEAIRAGKAVVHAYQPLELKLLAELQHGGNLMLSPSADGQTLCVIDATKSTLKQYDAQLQTLVREESLELWAPARKDGSSTIQSSVLSPDGTAAWSGTTPATSGPVTGWTVVTKGLFSGTAVHHEILDASSFLQSIVALSRSEGLRGSFAAISCKVKDYRSHPHEAITVFNESGVQFEISTPGNTSYALAELDGGRLMRGNSIYDLATKELARAVRPVPLWNLVCLEPRDPTPRSALGNRLHYLGNNLVARDVFFYRKMRSDYCIQDLSTGVIVQVLPVEASEASKDNTAVHAFSLTGAGRVDRLFVNGSQVFQVVVNK